jgi:hypothetical protein
VVEPLCLWVLDIDDFKDYCFTSSDKSEVFFLFIKTLSSLLKLLLSANDSFLNIGRINGAPLVF